MRKIIFIILALIISVSVFTGCNNGEQGGGNTSSAVILNEGEVNIFNFETKDELRSFSYPDINGKGLLNTDSKYIKNGNASMYLECAGYPSRGESTRPNVVMPVTKRVGIGEYEPLDITYYDEFRFDIFNASDREINIDLSVQDMNNVIGSVKKVTLQPNEWTTIDEELDLDSLAVTQSVNVDKIRNIILYQDNLTVNQTRSKLYIDNLIFREGNEKYIPPFNRLQRESTEIADFDDENYISLFKTVMAFDEETAPVYTFNSDPKYISQGSGSMKVVTKGNEGADNVAWPGISIQGKDKLNNINLTQYEAIAFDVYNDSDRELRLVFMLNDGFKVFDGIPSFIPSKSWAYIYIPVQSILEGYPQANLNEVYIMNFYMNGFLPELTDIVYYIDNLRVIGKSANYDAPLSGFNTQTDINYLKRSGTNVSGLTLNTDGANVHSGSGSLKLDASANGNFTSVKMGVTNRMTGFNPNLMGYKDWRTFKSLAFNAKFTGNNGSLSGETLKYTVTVKDEYGNTYTSAEKTLTESESWQEIVININDISAVANFALDKVLSVEISFANATNEKQTVYIDNLHLKNYN